MSTALEEQTLEQDEGNRRALSDRSANKRRSVAIAFLVLCFVVATAVLLAHFLPRQDHESYHHADHLEDPSITMPAPSLPLEKPPSLAPSTMQTAQTEETTSRINPPAPIIADLPAYTEAAILENPASPQALAYEWLAQHPDIAVLPEWRKQQLLALVTIYYAFDGPFWPDYNHKKWLNYSIHECDWKRVADEDQCNSDFRVTHLYFSFLYLTETRDQYLPREVSLLTSLETLWCQWNDFTTPLSNLIPLELTTLPNLTKIGYVNNNIYGTIPTEISLLQSSQLLIDLSNNQISGALPTELGLLNSTQTLNLAVNKIQGRIPTEMGLIENMKELRLNSNYISGSLVSELGSPILAETLFSLRLYNNSLTGNIPCQIGGLLNLRELSIGMNDLNGSLPSEMCQLTGLPSLSFGNVAISGSLPSELGLMTNLRSLYFQNTDITGSIPTEIGNNILLYRILMANTSITGKLPTELGRIKSLSVVSLNDNDITGSLPTELGLIQPYGYNDWKLQNNRISGMIPSELGILYGLGGLNVSNNLLVGPLPSEIGRLQYLRFLDISSNKCFNASIPTDLGRLNADRLEALDLSDASLWGTIPTELSWPWKMKTLRLSQNELTGTFPSELGRTWLREIDLADNQLTGDLPSEIGQFRYLKNLSLRNNQVSGLPSEVGMMRLWSLDLANNSITGPLPSEIIDLQSMRTLQLQHNQLTSTIPTLLGHRLYSLKLFDLSFNELSGSIPSQLSLLDASSTISLTGNNFQGTVPKELCPWWCNQADGNPVFLELQDIECSSSALSRMGCTPPCVCNTDPPVATERIIP